MNDNQVMAIMKQLARIADALEQIEDSISSMDESFIISANQSSRDVGQDTISG